MGWFRRGVMVGMGVSLLFAPMTGEDLRHLVVERFRYLRGIPPENEELKQSLQEMAERLQTAQQIADRAAQMGTEMENYVERTASTVDEVEDELQQLAEQAGVDVPPARPGGTATNRQNRARRSTP
jgi:gas vesicle protein